MEGKKGSLADFREGAKVKASYETRNGKNMAKSTEVKAAEAKDSEARPGAPPLGGNVPLQPKTQ